MCQIVVNVGSFDLTSHNGNTAYSTTKYFDIPANAGITGCVATFATHANTGNFQGKSFSLNGAQAHPNTPWPTTDISLNAALLSAGQNTFRMAIKSQVELSARWSIGDISLTITYNDVGGGGGDPGGEDPPPQPPYIGGLAVDPTSITAGASLYIATGACDGGLIRHISIYRTDNNAFIASVVASQGIGAGTWLFPIPVAWSEFAPNDTQFHIRVELYAHYADGGWGGVENRIVGVTIPENITPTIGAFTATRDNNGLDASITNYVQNYSKVYLEMGSVAGALGSSIASYEITGGGKSAAASSATFGPFLQTGDITFTAKVTDTRGRTATKTFTINVLAYGPPAFSNPEAWRSNYDGVKNQKGTYVRLKSGASFSTIGGENAVTLKGRVYLKGGAAPAWEDMVPGTELILGGGALLFTRTYIAQMQVSDLLESRVTEFIIPTKKTGISIIAGMRGIAFGKSAETPDISDLAWPIVAPNFYPVGSIYMSINSTSPATLFGGTWAAIDAVRFLVAAGSGYPAGGTGGQSSFSLTRENLPDIAFDVLTQGSGSNTWGLPAPTSQGTAGWTPGYARSGGSGNAISIIPPWFAINVWRRTA